MLRVGGCAEHYVAVRTANDLAGHAIQAQRSGLRTTILGWGSNVVPADDGVPGLVIHNLATRIEITATEGGGQGLVLAESGCSFQELFLRSAQAGLRGLEFAVGIPGTLGGALVSNAGAYRSNVSEFLTALEIAVDGERRWVDPSWMEFAYRDSILRRPNPPACAIVQVRMALPKGDPKRIYDEAREYQRQRIAKQPPQSSVGSFFKNVNDHGLAERLAGLPEGLRRAGVVPAGFLIERAGLGGHRVGGASLSRRHANFIVNDRGATASDVRRLAEHAQWRVWETFGVLIEEEALYLGDWSGWDGRDAPVPDSKA
ncbi:MAG: UDP-N-acetylmuramate dehydrogenase [Fimbriimonadaceae bacterium]|nr:UDP-N-acetylmuramate dehydrogenase [Fimbriimonadaceae bacterium]